MKFGKRLAVEAARCWPDACLDYKAIKRALKHDLATGGKWRQRILVLTRSAVGQSDSNLAVD